MWRKLTERLAVAPWRRNGSARGREAASRTPAAAQAHMTFGATSVGRSISRVGLFAKRRLWIWPIVAIVVLAILGRLLAVQIAHTMEHNLTSGLETLVGVQRSMVETWLAAQEANAQSLANDQQVRRTAAILVGETPATSDENSAGQPADALAAQRALLAKELGPGMNSHRFAGFILADKKHRIVAANSAELVGQTIPEYEGFLAKALDGQTTVSPPFASVVMMKDERGRLATGLPTMFVCAPVRDDAFQVIGALGLRILPERDFTRILQLGRPGDSGETFAFDKAGRMVSNSRYDEELILLGILPDTENARSILNVSLRDPGGDLRQGHRPKVRRAELPLVEPVLAAIEGNAGVNVAGYRNYRGVKSVGAYTWLDKYDIGLITEVDYAEAFRPLTILRRAFFSLFGLLVLCSAAIFGFTLAVSRLQREARKAAVEARQLGQYRLEERLGAGAMGVVYKGHHAMLRRPTAIKMLSEDRVDEASIARFEREVQITCQLNNPSTIAIYDYGRTPEGVFYYAMEYLDGIDLQTLVERYGPQPESRVIHILRQVCGSLFEAHSQGLVHRDIKPANIMLNRRGGESDVVKVLDFGLVKALDEAEQTRASGGAMSGTPLYMSPEAIQSPESVDPRSDLYAVGGVGYFLLTGQPMFSANSLAELCRQHVVAVPDTPSSRLGKPISVELESAILACLEKSRAKRPQTARDLAAMLARSPAAKEWTIEYADAWWGRHERSASTDAGAASASSGNGMRSGQATVTGNSTGLDRTIAHESGDR